MLRKAYEAGQQAALEKLGSTALSRYFANKFYGKTPKALATEYKKNYFNKWPGGAQKTPHKESAEKHFSWDLKWQKRNINRKRDASIPTLNEELAATPANEQKGLTYLKEILAMKKSLRPKNADWPLTSRLHRYKSKKATAARMDEIKAEQLAARKR